MVKISTGRTSLCVTGGTLSVWCSNTASTASQITAFSFYMTKPSASPCSGTTHLLSPTFLPEASLNRERSCASAKHIVKPGKQNSMHFLGDITPSFPLQILGKRLQEVQGTLELGRLSWLCLLVCFPVLWRLNLDVRRRVRSERWWIHGKFKVPSSLNYSMPVFAAH